MSLPAGTEMFHFPAYGAPGLCVQPAGSGGQTPLDCSIRKSPDQSVLATPRGLSQLATSFVA